MKLPLPNSFFYEAKELEKSSWKVSLFQFFFYIEKFYIYIYVCVCIYLISCHKPKNNLCLPKCYQCFSNRVKIYFSNSTYNLFKLVHHPYTKEIFDNTKRVTLHPIVDEIGGKKGSQKNNKICLRTNHIFNV